jgi:hypothetical protein
VKLTKKRLQQIIVEEKARLLESQQTDAADPVDPDDKVTMILNQIGKLLEDAYEIAGKAPDHQNKGEGYAMGEIVHSVDSWYSTYGSGGWQ